MSRIKFKPLRFSMKIVALLLACLSVSFSPDLAISSAFAFQAVNPPALSWPAGLPVYDHIVIIVEENKDYDQIIGSKNAPYINSVLKKEGASLTQMYGEEHHSQGNYFWLFSGSNQNVGFADRIPASALKSANLGEELIRAGYSFKGYSEGLPEIGSTVVKQGLYARKHVPWISFSNVPNGQTVSGSSNLRFPADFPSDYNSLPTLSFVIPNLVDDMHDGPVSSSVPVGDEWLKKNIAGYYEWAKRHNSLLILTFDESDESTLIGGLTDPANNDPNKRNRIVTILAGAHIKAGEYAEGKGVNHVSLLRTIEAMYKLDKSGAQPWNALKAGIADDFLIKDIFSTAP
jgi:phosphatidylinositol-3-phosphatase